MLTLPTEATIDAMNYSPPPSHPLENVHSVLFCLMKKRFVQPTVCFGLDRHQCQVLHTLPVLQHVVQIRVIFFVLVSQIFCCKLRINSIPPPCFASVHAWLSRLSLECCVHENICRKPSTFSAGRKIAFSRKGWMRSAISFLLRKE